MRAFIAMLVLGFVFVVAGCNQCNPVEHKNCDPNDPNCQQDQQDHNR